MSFIYLIVLTLLFISCDSNVNTPIIPVEESLVHFDPKVGDLYSYYDEIYVISYNEPYEDHEFVFEAVDEVNREWELDALTSLITVKFIRQEEPNVKKYWWYSTKYNSGTLIGKLKDTTNSDLIKFQLFLPDTLVQGEIDMFGIKTHWNFHPYGQTLTHFDNGNMYSETYLNVWRFTSTDDTHFKNGTLNSNHTFLKLHDSTWTFRDLVRNIIQK